MDETGRSAAGQPAIASLYLETLIARVDKNKYRLIRRLVGISHDLLEDKSDPLREPVDDVLRKAAVRLVAAADKSSLQPSETEQ